MQEQQESQGDDEDINASTYSELAKLFLDAEMVDDADVETQAAAAESFVELILAASSTMEEDEDESDPEETRPAWGGSKPGKSPNKNRDFSGAHNKLVEHYFCGEGSLYNEADFERRFRMPRSVFNRIFEALVHEEEYPFVQKYDSISKKPGISPLCRLVACLRKVCYGDADDREDEYLQMSETSVNESVKAFSRLMVEKFGAEYLNRCPTEAETKRAIAMMAKRNFDGAFGAWDCKHFVWKNCPVYLQGRHKGHAEGGKKTLILEAVADCDGYLWYVFFGAPGSLNDLNVLDKSSIVSRILTGEFDVKVEPYTINGTTRDWIYFLVDGIYLAWSIFVKPLFVPADEKEKAFNTAQEAARKCVERVFGQLVAQFEILKNPIRNMKMEDIVNILYCCVIIHNMVTAERRLVFKDGDVMFEDHVQETQEEEENGNAFRSVSLFGYQQQPFDPSVTTPLGHRVSQVLGKIEDSGEHVRLMADLIEHVWSKTQQRNED